VPLDLDALLRARVVDVADFPSPGIVFKDIAPVLGDPTAFAAVVAAVVERWRGQVDAVLAVEARGFLLGAPVALALEASLVPCRKPGKLPRAVREVRYALEYGSDALQVHLDGLVAGQRVLVVDDVLATGGTAAAAVELVRQSGADPVGLAVLLELGFLPGRVALPGLEVQSLLVV
jgi:adenine phosphoribosyltransferase